MTNLETLISILGDDNVEKIKETITEELIDNIRESIREQWFIVPESFNDLIQNEIEKQSKRLIKQYSADIRDALEKRINDIVEEINHPDLVERNNDGSIWTC